MLHDPRAPVLSGGLLDVNCGILHSSDLINALKELLLMNLQYKKPMLKERPAEGRVNMLPQLG